MTPTEYFLWVSLALFVGFVWNKFEIADLHKAGEGKSKKVKTLEWYSNAYLYVICTILSTILTEATISWLGI